VYDVIIVGGGPAGLSAALVLGRCRRNVLICDAGEPRNRHAESIHGYLTRDGTPPMDFLEMGREEVRRYGVEVRQAEVTHAERREDWFSVRLAAGEELASRMLLLATGVVDELPAVEGAREFYGRSLWHCPYCDGWEARDRPLGVYGHGKKGLGLALSLKTWSDDVILFTDGQSSLDEDLQARLDRNAVGLEERRIRRLEGEDGELRRVVLEDGASIERRGMFFETGQRQRYPLAERLGCRFSEEGVVLVDSHSETGVPGLFVCGDASEDVQFVVVAAAEGAKAAVKINTAFMREESA
jgi:thioredoxin reductase